MPRLVKSVLEPVRHAGRQNVHAVRLQLSRRTGVAHQGIQRSGTNYLRELLVRSGYLVTNAVDPHRDDVRHKHFRWQDDKATITMDRKYLNNRHVNSLEGLNEACGYAPGQRHVLVFKRPGDWLSSIWSWGVANDWVSSDISDGDCESVLLSWLREWDHYHTKWFELVARSPELARVICYDDLVRDPVRKIGEVHAMTGVIGFRPLPEGGRVKKVAHSTALTGTHRRPAAVPLNPNDLADRHVNSPWHLHVDPPV